MPGVSSFVTERLIHILRQPSPKSSFMRMRFPVLLDQEERQLPPRVAERRPLPGRSQTEVGADRAADARRLGGPMDAQRQPRASSRVLWIQKCFLLPSLFVFHPEAPGARRRPRAESVVSLVRVQVQLG